MESKESLFNPRRKGGVDVCERLMTSQVASAIEERWQVEIENTSYEGYARETLQIEPVRNLNEANLDETLCNNIRSVYQDLSPLQRHTVPILAQNEGLSLIVKAPTGSGKTAAFLIPAIQTALTCRKPRGGQPLVLILGNTNNLCLQTLRMGKQFAGCTNDGNSSTGVELAGLFGGSDRCVGNVYQDIVVATTGKLLKVLSDETYNAKIDLSHLRMLIIDEFDCMIQASRFGLEIKEIFGKYIPSDVKAKMKIGLFSATIEQDIVDNNIDILEPLLVSYAPGQDYNDPLALATTLCVEGIQGHITQRVYKIDDTPFLQANGLEERIQKHSFTQRLVALLALLDAEYRSAEENKPAKKTIIFAEKKVTCNYLATLLLKMGYNFLPVNSDYDPRTVDKIISKLKKAEIQGVVATNKLCRGQDIPEVDHVIVFEMSTDFSSYQHRIGRTGRAGRGGKSTVLFRAMGDAAHATPFVAFLHHHLQKIPKWLWDQSDYGETTNGHPSVSDEERSVIQSDMDEVQGMELNGSALGEAVGSLNEDDCPYNTDSDFSLSDHGDLPIEPP